MSHRVSTIALNGVKILFFDYDKSIVEAWNHAFAKYLPARLRPQVRTLTSALDRLPGEDKIFDCIVSPANSYGRMDGSFDFYLSEALAPPNDAGAPTRQVQTALYHLYRGFAPPSTCTLVSLAGTNFSAEKNAHKCNFIAVCPTMRVPQDVRWDRDVVYECTWTLLNAIDNHNVSCPEADKIRKVVCPGLATGIGKVSPDKCAEQMVLAIKHYEEAVNNPSIWGALEWDHITETVTEMTHTHTL